MMEEWKDGTLRHTQGRGWDGLRTMDDGETSSRSLDNQGCLSNSCCQQPGRLRRETGEEMFSVHDGEPPFVGKDDADTFESPLAPQTRNHSMISQILLPENEFQQEKVFSYNLIVHKFTTKSMVQGY
jgi:hypothetical protein